MKSTDAKKASATQQRDALARSEKRAAQQEPQNFKDRATAEKVVEIPAAAKRNDAIKGLDPK